jgi:formyltetrahydrofolate-dependent phosphoribosylglycinamide formyltransferase
MAKGVDFPIATDRMTPVVNDPYRKQSQAGDMQGPIRLAVLLSGTGRTLQNLIDKIKQGSLDARIEVVVGSRADAFGLQRAKNHGIPVVVVERKRYRRAEEFCNEITAQLDKYAVDLVIMAGFNCLYKIPDKYIGRVMNIHPALIPSFCGKNYWGMKVHEAALDYGVKVSGCTVHFADNTYDNGPIILQRTVPVINGDTPESLAERVFKEECVAYPEAIRLFQQGRLRIEGRKVSILP